MSLRPVVAALLLMILFEGEAAGQKIAQSPPVARLESDVPTAAVTAIAFSPDGKTLYAAGFDKIIRVWRWDEKAGTFTADPAAFLRVPVGPGRNGMMNCLAVSPDGKLLAASGL